MFGGETGQIEDCTWDEFSKCECLSQDKLGLMLWFDEGQLSKVHCSYLFEADNETIIWPQQTQTIDS